MQPIQSMAMNMQNIIQQQEMRLFQLSQMVEQKELASVRSQLQERFPQLADDKRSSRSSEKMTRPWSRPASTRRTPMSCSTQHV
jgi:hypothetical protein